MLEIKLQNSINKMMNDVKNSKLEFITVEHLLLALIDTTEVVNFLLKKEVDVNKLKIEINEFIENNVTVINNGSNFVSTPTVGFQRVLQRSVFNAQSAQKQMVSALSVLVSIFSENESQAVYLLKLNNISKLEIMQELSSVKTETQGQATQSQAQVKKPTTLEKWATNLNKKALEGKIDPLIGRESEVERAIQVLSKRRKNNPMFVGEPGVGKTAIAGGIALQIVNKKVPKSLEKAVIHSIDVGDLVAGTKYRGEFEERLKNILKALKKDKNNIVFIDEIHMLVGAGNSGSAMDAANLLKPSLADGTLRMMGATTDDEYRKIIEKDSALSRRLQKIEVLEPNFAETLLILQGLKEKYQDYHGVKYSDDSLQSAVNLASKYITSKKLPDKAIDVIDEAGSFAKLNNKKEQIEVIDIEKIVANITKIPVASVNTDNTNLRYLADNIKLSVFGQDEAIDEITTAIKLARSGLNDANKPIGSFLCTGATGVGKTELVKQLSLILGVKLLRFDMSEYMDRHSNSKLIGSPPGFVGFEEGGVLTEGVHKNPHCIVLLDEIEKAHPDIFNLLLQIMDNGKITDGNGREIDFTNVLLVMTSNVGAEVASQNTIGFNENNSNKFKQELSKTFTPEFRNRLSNVLYFNQLNQDTILSIVDKFIFGLENKLSDKGVKLSISSSAKKWLAKNGYDEKMGARPMSRLIEKEINTKLSDELLFGSLKDGGTVKVGVKADKINLEIKKLAKVSKT